MDKGLNNGSNNFQLYNFLDGTEKLLFKSKWRNSLFWFLFVAAFSFRLFNIDNPLTQEMHSFRQAQTAITVQCYFNDGWSFFNYETPVFGAPWKVIFECPIYQSIVYIFMKLTGLVNVDVGCRIISVIMFMLSAIVLYCFSLLVTNERMLSIIIYTIYLFLPYNIYWSRAALIDYTSVLFGLMYAYALIHWLYHGKKIYYYIALLSGVLAYLQKVTSMFPVVVILSMLIFKYYYNGFKQSGSNLKKYVSNIFLVKLLPLILLCVIPVIIGYLWVVYSDISKFKLYYARELTSAALKKWNYGTWSQKMNIGCWRIILNRIKSYSCGVFILVYFFIFSLSPRYRKKDYIKCLILKIKKHLFITGTAFSACFFTLVILFNLYYVHNYYIIALTPYLSILAGVMTYDIICSANHSFSYVSVSIATVLILLVTCISDSENISYLDYIFKERKEPYDIWKYISDNTLPDERIIIEGHDWTSEIPYKMNRKCFMLRSIDDDNYFAHNIFPYDKYTVVFAEHPERLENTLSECSLAVGRLGISAYMADIVSCDKSDIVGDAIPVIRENNQYILNVRSEDLLIFTREAGDSQKCDIKVTLSDGNTCDCTIFFLKNADTAVYSLATIANITAISCSDDITGVSVHKVNYLN